MQAGFQGFSAVIDDGEEADGFGLERGAEAGYGLRDAVSAGDADDAVGCGLFHGALRGYTPMGCGARAADAESF